MKHRFFLSAWLLVITANVFCQQDAVSVRCEGRTYTIPEYFEDVHQKYKGELCDLPTLHFLLTFKVADDSTVVDIEPIEIPFTQLSERAEKYIRKLFSECNGRWYRTNAAASKKPVQDMACYFFFINWRQTQLERLKDEMKYLEHLGPPKREQDKRFWEVVSRHDINRINLAY